MGGTERPHPPSEGGDTGQLAPWELSGKARKSGQLGQMWGSLRESRRGQHSPPRNRLCRGQAWQLRVAGVLLR